MCYYCTGERHDVLLLYRRASRCATIVQESITMCYYCTGEHHDVLLLYKRASRCATIVQESITMCYYCTGEHHGVLLLYRTALRCATIVPKIIKHYELRAQLLLLRARLFVSTLIIGHLHSICNLNCKKT